MERQQKQNESFHPFFLVNVHVKFSYAFGLAYFRLSIYVLFFGKDVIP